MSAALRVIRELAYSTMIVAAAVYVVFTIAHAINKQREDRRRLKDWKQRAERELRELKGSR